MGEMRTRAHVRDVGLPTSPRIRCAVEGCCARPPYRIEDEHGELLYLACTHHADQARGRIVSVSRTEPKEA